MNLNKPPKILSEVIFWQLFHKGDYARLLPALEPLNIDRFVLEYATPRAGDTDVLRKKHWCKFSLASLTSS